MDILNEITVSQKFLVAWLIFTFSQTELEQFTYRVAGSAPAAF